MRRYCGARALLADAVSGTLGPKSKSVLIQKSKGAPIVCNDGVTIAKEFDLPEENPAPRRFARPRRELATLAAMVPAHQLILAGQMWPILCLLGPDIVVDKQKDSSLNAQWDMRQQRGLEINRSRVIPPKTHSLSRL